MKVSKLGERFFESTRGRIVRLLRGATKTVNALASELGLTDNAVRAHLLSLERDGLIRQSGMQRGMRKPHFAYELAPEAEDLFPKAYDAVVDQLITVLKGRLAPEDLNKVLREVGRAFATRHVTSKVGADFEDRVQEAVKALEAIGGAPQVGREDGILLIRSGSCPLAAVVSEHPEVCELAEALVAEILGVQVHEQCDRTRPAKCCFQIDEAGKPAILLG